MLCKRQVCVVAGYFFVVEGEGESQSEGVGLFFYLIGREWQVGFYKARQLLVETCLGFLAQ